MYNRTQFLLRFLIGFLCMFQINFILLTCIYIHCFNFTFHFIITDVRSKRRFLPALIFGKIFGRKTTNSEEIIIEKWDLRERLELKIHPVHLYDLFVSSSTPSEQFSRIYKLLFSGF